MTLKIGALARLTGTNAPTIRYYEEIALLPEPARQEGGQRCYGSEDVRRLTIIRQCRDLGFAIEQIRELIALTGDNERSCTDARVIAQNHLEAVDSKLEELKRLRQTLGEFIRRCDQICAGGPGPDCVILHDLADPGSGRIARTARP